MLEPRVPALAEPLQARQLVLPMWVAPPPPTRDVKLGATPFLMVAADTFLVKAPGPALKEAGEGPLFAVAHSPGPLEPPPPKKKSRRARRWAISLPPLVAPALLCLPSATPAAALPTT